MQGPGGGVQLKVVPGPQGVGVTRGCGIQGPRVGRK